MYLTLLEDLEAVQLEVAMQAPEVAQMEQLTMVVEAVQVVVETTTVEEEMAAQVQLFFFILTQEALLLELVLQEQKMIEAMVINTQQLQQVQEM